ncbi:MAG: DUF4384 domain-containing protein, partial [Hyphomicrobium sp.]|nr:DUF4384 domain-containing protein [Hyphomicrobium sp.]
EIRFLSFANLDNMCRSDAALAAYRAAAALMLRRLSTTTAAVAVETIGASNALLSFRPRELGFSTVEWDALAAGGEDAPGVAAAEAVAAAALASPERYDASRAAAAEPISGLDPVVALASEWTRPVTLARAAAERGEDSAALSQAIARRLSEGSFGTFEPVAEALAQGTIERDRWRLLSAVLDGARVALPEQDMTPADPAKPLEIAIRTEQLQYRSGDDLVIHAEASRTCYLTLIAVEPDGTATVLFPSDFVTDNKVQGGVTITTPANGQGFRLVLDDPGRHLIHAICNTRVPRPEGVGHDLERQRFTMLGDWRAFLASTAAREAAYKAEQAAAQRFRERRRRREDAERRAIETAALPDAPEEEARAAVAIEVTTWPAEAAAPEPPSR